MVTRLLVCIALAYMNSVSAAGCSPGSCGNGYWNGAASFFLEQIAGQNSHDHCFYPRGKALVTPHHSGHEHSTALFFPYAFPSGFSMSWENYPSNHFSDSDNAPKAYATGSYGGTSGCRLEVEGHMSVCPMWHTSSCSGLESTCGSGGYAKAKVGVKNVGAVSTNCAKWLLIADSVIRSTGAALRMNWVADRMLNCKTANFIVGNEQVCEERLGAPATALMPPPLQAPTTADKETSVTSRQLLGGSTNSVL